MISTFLHLHFYFYISYDYFLLDFIFIYVFSFLEHSELIPNISSKINFNDIILFSCVHALSSPNLHFFQRFFFCNFKLNFFNTSRRSHEFFWMCWYYSLWTIRSYQICLALLMAPHGKAMQMLMIFPFKH